MIDKAKLDTVASCDLLLIELQVRFELASSERLRFVLRDEMDEVLDHRLRLVKPAHKRKVPAARA